MFILKKKYKLNIIPHFYIKRKACMVVYEESLTFYKNLSRIG